MNDSSLAPLHVNHPLRGGVSRLTALLVLLPLLAGGVASAQPTVVFTERYTQAYVEQFFGQTNSSSPRQQFLTQITPSGSVGIANPWASASVTSVMTPVSITTSGAGQTLGANCGVYYDRAVCGAGDFWTFSVDQSTLFTLTAHGTLSFAPSTAMYTYPGMEVAIQIPNSGSAAAILDLNGSSLTGQTGRMALGWTGEVSNGSVQRSVTAVLRPGTYTYQCSFYGSTQFACPSASSAFQLEGGIAFDGACLAITEQPRATPTCIGQSTRLHVAVNSPVTPTYRWQVENSPGSGTWSFLQDGPLFGGPTIVAGVTTSTLTFTSTATSASSRYRCRLSSPACGTVFSDAAVLAVSGTAVSINHEPADTHACFGGTAMFSVDASGSGPTFQWRRAGAELPDQRNPVLTLANLSLPDFGTYDCVVRNGCSEVTTRGATLTRDPGPAIRSAPSHALCIGAPLVLHVDAADASLYSWYKDDLPLQAGASSTLDLGAATNADFGTYVCVVSGAGSCGTAIATLGVSVFDTIPVVYVEPFDVAGCIGQSATLEVVTNGTSLRWYKDGIPIEGATDSTLEFDALVASDAGAYSCVVSDFFCGSVSTRVAHVSICGGDYNCSGSVGVQDIFDFLAGYFSGAANADFNGSGVISVQDIFDFLAAYFAGC